MRTLLILCALASIFHTASAQKNKPSEPVSQPAADTKSTCAETARTMYNLALRNGDPEAATMAVYQILACGGSPSYNDTLAILYFQRGMYAQTILVTTPLIEKDPANAGLLELSAVSKQSLGALKESLDDYEKLIRLNRNVYHMYEAVTIQYQLKRYGEAEASAMAMLGNPDIDGKTIQLSDGSAMQNVPLKAALLNLLGVMYIETGKKEIAVKKLEEALGIMPDFSLAKGNLDLAKKP